MEVSPFETSYLFDANYDLPERINLSANQGGTSSGKTYSLSQVDIMKAYCNSGSITTIVAQDIPSLKAGVMRDFRAIIDGSKLVQGLIKSYNKTDRIYTFWNGAQIEFNSYEDEQDAKNGKRDFLFVNEVNGISHAIFDALFVRTRLTTWVDYNPTGNFWLQDKGYLKRPTTRFIKSTFLNNPFLDQETVKKIQAYEPTPENITNGTADEYRWKVYGLGEVAQMEGAILPKWRRGKWDESLSFGYGLDFGFSPDPTALSRVAIDTSKSLIYVEELAYLTELSTGGIKTVLDTYTKRGELIVADCAEKRLINDLIEDNYNVQPCRKGAGSIKSGLKNMQDYEIIVCGSSINLEMELNNYVWNDKKAGIPIDKFNHLIDGVRYAFDRLTISVGLF